METAHQLINDSDHLLTTLCVSTMIEPEVVQQPDSGKLGAIAGAASGGAKDRRTLYWLGKTAKGCGYWEGEQRRCDRELAARGAMLTPNRHIAQGQASFRPNPLNLPFKQR